MNRHRKLISYTREITSALWCLKIVCYCYEYCISGIKSIVENRSHLEVKWRRCRRLTVCFSADLDYSISLSFSFWLAKIWCARIIITFYTIKTRFKLMPGTHPYTHNASKNHHHRPHFTIFFSSVHCVSSRFISIWIRLSLSHLYIFTLFWIKCNICRCLREAIANKTTYNFGERSVSLRAMNARKVFLFSFFFSFRENEIEPSMKCAAQTAKTEWNGEKKYRTNEQWMGFFEKRKEKRQTVSQIHWQFQTAEGIKCYTEN